jgi:hypothetical protein
MFELWTSRYTLIWIEHVMLINVRHYLEDLKNAPPPPPTFCRSLAPAPAELLFHLLPKNLTDSKLFPITLFWYEMYKPPFSQIKTACVLGRQIQWVDTRTTCNPITADLRLIILNSRYDLQVHIRTPDLFRTPAKHLHLPTIAVKLGFLNPNNNHLEFRKVSLSLFCTRYL